MKMLEISLLILLSLKYSDDLNLNSFNILGGIEEIFVEYSQVTNNKNSNSKITDFYR